MQKRLILTSFIALTLLAGCCHKKGCIDGDTQGMIHLYDFKPSETDTLMIKRFEKSSGFGTKIDSAIVTYSQPGVKDTLQHIAIPINMQLDSDWEISIPATGAIYRVSGFVFAKQVCNACWAGNDYYTQLQSYLVNGTRFQKGAIVLYR